ncbi:MAG: alpha/beta fold hydrolase [Rubrivivax sp.]
MPSAYQPKRTARSEFIRVRNLDYHVHIWGEHRAGLRPLVMVHGWMDVGASFQFVVDELEKDRLVIAPDLRGFGLTRMRHADGWWDADHLGDLDGLLEHYSPGEPVDLAGHSMGADIVMTYAGVRPHRIRKLVNLEGFGRPHTPSEQAPERLAKWLDDLRSFHRGEKTFKAHDTIDGVARRLMQNNRRLPRDRADWLARHWSRRDENGQWRILGDPVYKVTRAHLHRAEEEQAIWRAIAAPVLGIEAIEGSFEQWWGDAYKLEDYLERVKSVPNFRRVVVEDAGHMLHHDQPAQVARLIEEFLQA